VKCFFEWLASVGWPRGSHYDQLSVTSLATRALVELRTMLINFASDGPKLRQHEAPMTRRFRPTQARFPLLIVTCSAKLRATAAEVLSGRAAPLPLESRTEGAF